jgi:putative ABC transport system permease protein
LLRQSIAELVPMLAIGGVLGVASAKWTIDLVVPMLPADVPRAENVALPLPVLLFAAATLAAIAALVGLWPALEAARGELAAAAADSSRTATTSARRTRLRDALVVGQIAATLWLAIGAALLTRSLAELKRVDPGFNPDGVYSLHLAIPRTKYGTDRAVNAFCTRVLERVVALPGVVSAGMVNRLPLAGGTQTAPFEFEGVDPGLNRDRLGVQADFRSITPDYFRTLAMPLVSGRAFTDADSDESTPVAIVDDRLARMIFGAASPLGRRLRVSIAGEPWATIVGVVGHVHHDRLDEDGRSQIYWPYHQRGQDRMALVVRTRGNPAAIASSLVAAIHSVDPEQPVYDARTLDAVVDRSLGQRWFQTTVLGSFAVVALLLASIGVYGVIAYGVNQRAREFGIRLALGASRGDIVALVLWRGTFLFVAGAVLGLVAAMATERVLGTLVFGVRASDAISFGSATAVLLAVSLAACALPARRAGRVDPSVALRAE